MAEAAVAETKGNLTEYMNCNCRLDGGIAGGKAPTVVYEAPKNVRPGKLVSDASSVVTIQKFLNKEDESGQKPKEHVKEDSRWGTGTSTAFYRRMVDIQEKNGITPNGKYNSETADIMRKNGMGREADALDKMKKEGTLDRVYNHKLAKVICDGAEGGKPATEAPSAPNNDARTPGQGIRNEKVDRNFIDALQGKVEGREQADLYKPNIPGLKEAADIVSGGAIKSQFNLTAEHGKAVANQGPWALDRKPDIRQPDIAAPSPGMMMP